MLTAVKNLSKIQDAQPLTELLSGDTRFSVTTTSKSIILYVRKPSVAHLGGQHKNVDGHRTDNFLSTSGRSS